MNLIKVVGDVEADGDKEAMVAYSMGKFYKDGLFFFPVSEDEKDEFDEYIGQMMIEGGDVEEST